MKVCSLTMSRTGEPVDHVPSFADEVVVYPAGIITDFAEARNAALDMAAKSGCDWAVFQDTDEELQVPDGGCVRTWLLDGISMLHVWSADGSYCKPRIFKTPRLGRYVMPTHEAYVVDGGKAETVPPTVMTFSESPKSPEQYREKAERDRGILEKFTQENPDDPRGWYYLGDTYSGLGMKEEAKRAFLKCYLLDGWDEEAAWAAYRKATIEIEEGDYAWALSSCVSGMKHHPGMAELPWLAGYCCYKLGRYQHAIWWEMMAVSLNDEEAHTHRINFRHEPALWEGPADVLKHAYAALGNDKAAEFWGKSCDRVMKMRLDKSRAT